MLFIFNFGIIMLRQDMSLESFELNLSKTYSAKLGCAICLY